MGLSMLSESPCIMYIPFNRIAIKYWLISMKMFILCFPDTNEVPAALISVEFLTRWIGITEYTTSAQTAVTRVGPHCLIRGAVVLISKVN